MRASASSLSLLSQPIGLSGLRRTSVHINGRIVALADVFDALTHERPYKQAWPVDRAVDEISSLRGRQFDPDAVEAFHQLDPYDLAEREAPARRANGSSASSPDAD